MRPNPVVTLVNNIQPAAAATSTVNQTQVLGVITLAQVPYTGLADGMLALAFVLAVIAVAGMATRAILTHDLRSRLAFAAAGFRRRLHRPGRREAPASDPLLQPLIVGAIERDVWLGRDALEEISRAAYGDETSAFTILDHIVAITRTDRAITADSEMLDGDTVRAIIARAR